MRLDRPLQVLFAAPAYWPAAAFGGPIPVMLELASGLVEAGCSVEVVTSSLTSPSGPRTHRTRTLDHDGSSIRYLATPLNYRWMGITPTLPVLLERGRRPDLVHIFGFRDPVGTAVAAWCRLRGVPYVFEALGMFRPKLRKVGLKSALDASIFRHVPGGAARLLACSELERDEYLAGGIAPGQIAVRPNGFPRLIEQGPGKLRSSLGLAPQTPLILSVGRVASGKGLELLVAAVADHRDVHLAIVGPDDGHGVGAELDRLRHSLRVAERVHLVGPLAHGDVLKSYAEADVVALVSAHESFGMVAAEAAAARRAIIVSDRCGVAELLDPAGALVTRFDGDAVREGIALLLGDPALRARLGHQAGKVAEAWSWDRVVGLQRSLYEDVVSAAGRRPR